MSLYSFSPFLSIFLFFLLPLPFHLPSNFGSETSSVLEMAGFLRDFLALGELGLVSVLSFEAVTREDTAEYTCTASSVLPQTTTLEVTSPPISLTVLGELSFC